MLIAAELVPGPWDVGQEYAPPARPGSGAGELCAAAPL